MEIQPTGSDPGLPEFMARAANPSAVDAASLVGFLALWIFFCVRIIVPAVSHWREGRKRGR